MAVSAKLNSSNRVNSFGSTENQDMAENLKTERLNQNDVIFDQNSAINSFYIVRQGLLGVYRHVYPSKKILVHKVGPGYSIGLSQLIKDTPFPGQLVPIKETVAFKGDKNDADTFCEQYPAAVTRLLAKENNSHDDTVQVIDQLIGKDLDARIAHELLDLASRIGQHNEHGIKIIVKLTRKQISEMVGCAQESVIRIMSEWEDKNWIETEHKYITILRPHNLKSTVNN